LKHVTFKSQGSIPLFKVVSFFIPKFCEKFCHYFFHNVCWWKTIIQMYWCSLCHCLECELVTHFFFAKIFFGNLIEFPAKKLFKIQFFLQMPLNFCKSKHFYNVLWIDFFLTILKMCPNSIINLFSSMNFQWKNCFQ